MRPPGNVFSPLSSGQVRRRLPQFFILHQLNRHVAKGLVRKIPRDMGKIPRGKSGVAVRELDLHRRLAFDFIRKVRIAKVT
jgi:hypothetical protein